MLLWQKLEHEYLVKEDCRQMGLRTVRMAFLHCSQHLYFIVNKNKWEPM